jgi:hypothetical protein
VKLVDKLNKVVGDEDAFVAIERILVEVEYLYDRSILRERGLDILADLVRKATE